jgi:predicted ATPase/DNA-binding CsgD family transcriptional regulator/DNA-binding XRE family transcriptional regulator
MSQGAWEAARGSRSRDEGRAGGRVLERGLPPDELRARRRALGLSQSALAESLGVTANTVARWERGEQRVGNPERLGAALARLEDSERVVAPPSGASSHQSAVSGPVPQKPHNLPVQLTSFVGREQEVADVHRLLGTTRLLTLTGAGGIGKTRLALEVAARLIVEYPDDGVWLVELGPIGDSALVLQSVAAVLGVPEEVGQTLVESLTVALSRRGFLLILDNCEHLLRACADLADIVLRASPQTRIIATSREPLRIGGETVWRVPSLSLPELGRGRAPAELEASEAVRLFLQRAQAAQPSFALTDQYAPAIAELCSRLDGIPLAIELAAACADFLSPEQMLARLEDRFALLTRGSRTAPARQQSLADAIEWSCSLLTAPERRLFARLSVFSGSFTLEAAEAVCAGEGIGLDQVLDLLGRLVSKSLVIAEPGPGWSMGYRLLETLRDFGRKLLRTSGEAVTFKRRQAAFYVQLATRSLDEGAPASWAERLTRQHDNLDAALRWLIENGEVEGAQLVGAALSNVWRQRGHVGEGRVIMSRLLALPGATEATRARASLLVAAGGLAYYQGDLAAARDLLNQCLSVLQPLGDRRELPLARTYLADVDMACGDHAAAHTNLEAGLLACRRLGDGVMEAILLVRLGQLAYEEGNDEAAQAFVYEALPTLRAHGGKRMLAFSLKVLADGATRRGEHGEARRLLEESLATWNEIRGWQGAARVHLDLGRLATEEGNNDLAANHFAEGLTKCRDIGDRWGLALGLEGFATLAIRAGRPEHAVQLAGAAAALREAAHVALSPRQAAWLQDDLASARRAVPGRKYVAAWEAGHAMPVERAFRLALGVRQTEARGRLTRRESEVAALIAQGLTNRQIAEALVLATKTVDAHTDGIRNKLGLHSRAQIAAWAVEQRLSARLEG